MFSVRVMKDNKGFAFIETVVALALLGVVAAVFLNSIGTAAKATMVADEEVTAESLVRSEMEYIKSCAYQDLATEYPIDPTLSIPNRWSMPEPTVEALDNGIQKVTITVRRDGEDELSAVMYKVDR